LLDFEGGKVEMRLFPAADGKINDAGRRPVHQ
jgi:hypothetical protein